VGNVNHFALAFVVETGLHHFHYSLVYLGKIFSLGSLFHQFNQESTPCRWIIPAKNIKRPFENFKKKNDEMDNK
jgi:hypothetical protein